MRTIVMLAAALALAGCGGAEDDGAGPGAGLPAGSVRGGCFETTACSSWPNGADDACASGSRGYVVCGTRPCSTVGCSSGCYNLMPVCL